MAEDGNIILPIIGYVLGFIIPIIGLVYGIVLFFWKKDEPYYAKHAKYIMVFSAVLWIIQIIWVLFF